MINLKRLKTSLTKHGAHKIAWLLIEYDPDTVLDRLNGSFPGVNIEEVQARKNLSVGRDGKVPQLWKSARSEGPDVVRALTLIAIIFSHHQLIEAMRKGVTGEFRGRVLRGDVLSGKAFTNFAHIVEELGYSTRHTRDYIDFDLGRLFHIPKLNDLFIELLSLKMKSAGWSGAGGVESELIDSRLYEVLGVEKTQFLSWISKGAVDEQIDSLEDADFFTDLTPTSTGGRYEFRPGHNPKKTGTVFVGTPISGKTASLIHNFIQNELYARLTRIFGESRVGCEVATGQGTFIDVVVEKDTFTWFYEIKVAKTVKACIRQALPQLLEYAFWVSDSPKIEKLIIVSTHELSQDGRDYLNKLRMDFNLPLFYEQFVED